MRARVVAALAGAGLYALALPPFDCEALAWFALVPLLLVVRGQPARRAFGDGLLYGCAFGWTVTWWAAQAAGRYFGLGTPLTVLALSLFYLVVSAPTFALFAAGAAVLLRTQGSAARRLAVPALWVATELVRARVVGQPWGLLGYTQHAHVGLIQLAALTGVYGVSFLVALGNTALVEALVLWRAGRGLRAAIATLVLPAAVAGALWAGGAAFAARGPAGGFGARPVAVVQTNVAPAFHWTRTYAESEVIAHVRATERLPDASHPALIVWPEHSVPLYVEGEPMLAMELAEIAKRHHADVLFGAPHYEAGRTYNSVRLITADGRNGGYYDKQHLVLFAEASLLPHAASAGPSESPREFSAGAGPGVLRSFVPVGVSICHEILYPELVGRAVRAGAELLVNVSNDGWLDGGYGVAAHQHFAMAAFRAVESRRYLVRAATTGVSGVIDPYGRVLEALAPGMAGVTTNSVAGRQTLTPYVRLGDAFAFACACAAAAALAGRRPALAWRRLRTAATVFPVKRSGAAPTPGAA